MAVAYGSISSSSWANNSSTVINRPSGTADGDVLFAFLAGSRNGGTDPAISSVPSGWTQILNTPVDGGVGRMISYYKVASSEPSSWTWTWTSSNPDTIGFVVRNTGGTNPSILSFTSDDGTTLNSASGVYSGGVTPPSSDSLLLFAVFSNTAGNSHSSHAITNSNPTWTEVLDTKSSLGTSAIVSFAYATRNSASATGNFTCTIDSGSGSTDSIGQLIALPPVINVSASAEVQSVTASVFGVSVTGGATVSPGTISATTSVQAPTVSTPTNPWTSTTKNNPDWTNTPKS